jgi:hypothetical protein
MIGDLSGQVGVLPAFAGRLIHAVFLPAALRRRFRRAERLPLLFNDQFPTSHAQWHRARSATRHPSGH